MGGCTDDRVLRVTRILEQFDADAILLSDLKDIRWTTGFTGSTGLLLLHAEASVFITDGRYIEQSRKEVLSSQILIADANLFETIPDLLERFCIGELLLQSDSMTVAQLEKLNGLIPSKKLVPVSGLLQALRASKDADELSAIRRALVITERTLEETLSLIVPGVKESELAAELDYRQRRAGAEGSAFDTIVAFGDHSAQPHARSTDRVLQIHESVLIDFGCFVDGYASDMTRMIFVGQPSREFRTVYSTVQNAQERAFAVAEAGILSCDLDRAARQIIEDAGFGEAFTHSLGHGVGLNIHEWPTISKRSDEPLPEGAIVTIEPGIYISGEFGVRIEDMICVVDGGCDRLNSLSTDLLIL